MFILSIRSLPLLALLLAGAIGSSGASGAQETSHERSSRHDILVGSVGELEFEIHYGRPKARGRQLWGGLVPWGKVWRAGANEATTIQVSKNARVLGNDIPAGRYSLFVIPEKTQWTFILNRVADQWGSFLYDSAEDLCRFSVETEAVDPDGPEHAEELTYSFENGQIYLAWGHLRAGFPIESP